MIQFSRQCSDSESFSVMSAEFSRFVLASHSIETYFCCLWEKIVELNSILDTSWENGCLPPKLWVKHLFSVLGLDCFPGLIFPKACTEPIIFNDHCLICSWLRMSFPPFFSGYFYRRHKIIFLVLICCCSSSYLFPIMHIC